MKHTMVLLWAVAFGAGIMAIAATWVRYRQERLAVVRRYSRFLLLSNLTVGAILATAYIATNVGDVRPVAATRSIAAAFLVISFWLVAAFMVEFVVVALDLIGRGLHGQTGGRVAACLAAAPIGLLAGLALADGDLSSRDLFGYSEALNVSLVVGGMVATARALGATRALVHTHYRRSVRGLYGLHLMAFSLIVAAAWLDQPAAWHVLLVSFLIVNLTPLVLLQPLLTHRRASPPVDPERDRALEAFTLRHGISRREREIVGLLLDGRTNSQIGDALCISTHTVKNHVYSVYRKVAVRNRVQLANLVRGR